MYYVKLPNLLIKFTKQFVFMFISLYLVQRKNVKNFSYKQTAIQSGVLTAGIILAQDILNRIENDFEVDDEKKSKKTRSIEGFNGDGPENSTKIQMNSNKMVANSLGNLGVNNSNVIKSTNNANNKADEVISVNKANDFNDKFDQYVESQTTNPPSLDFEEQKTEKNSQNTKTMDYINKYTHYNTTPGYTYVDPKAWRVPAAQPPICLTNTPCTVTPVMVNTSSGNEFLPYSYVKSNTELQNIEKATV